MRLDITTKNHIDCYQMLTVDDYKGYFYKIKCPKCWNDKCETTGRKVFCRKSMNTVEVKCTKCLHRFWTMCPDWWC